jgi:hypothetical protein
MNSPTLKTQPSSLVSFQAIYKMGGISSFILFAYCIATMLIFVIIGTPPKTVEEYFSILHANRLTGLLRLDLLTVLCMPLYYLLIYSIYSAMKKTDHEMVKLSTILFFIGLTLFLASPSVFSYLNLSDKYALATTDSQRNQILAAGEAISSTDMWHGTSAFLGGLIMQTGAFMLSLLMLRNNVFSRLIAYTGIIMFGLDLIHIIIAFFLPTIANIVMVSAGSIYLLWFLLVGIRLFKLAKESTN